MYGEQRNKKEKTKKAIKWQPKDMRFTKTIYAISRKTCQNFAYISWNMYTEFQAHLLFGKQ